MTILTAEMGQHKGSEAYWTHMNSAGASKEASDFLGRLGRLHKGVSLGVLKDGKSSTELLFLNQIFHDSFFISFVNSYL